MADAFNPLWKDSPVPVPDLGGDAATSRGSDPNAAGGDGPNGLNPNWANPPVSVPGGEESSNSVSGLPSLPNRFAPSGTPPPPPDLTERNPGTIDQK